MTQILFLAAAYFLGSIPCGLFAGRMIKGIDIREHGSKNIGATNVFRVVGKKWGMVVFILDMTKGALAVSLPHLLNSQSPFIFSAVLGMTAILGHAFPIWLSFKGGKGVATSLGVFLALAFVPTLLTFGIWCIIFAITRIISISSLVAAAAFPIVLCWRDAARPEFPVLFPLSLALALFIFYTHRANISRLARGEEKRLF